MFDVESVAVAAPLVPAPLAAGLTLVVGPPLVARPFLVVAAPPLVSIAT
jgi:hypothetical protein